MLTKRTAKYLTWMNHPIFYVVARSPSCNRRAPSNTLRCSSLSHSSSKIVRSASLWPITHRIATFLSMGQTSSSTILSQTFFLVVAGMSSKTRTFSACIKTSHLHSAKFLKIIAANKSYQTGRLRSVAFHQSLIWERPLVTQKAPNTSARWAGTMLT